MPHDFDQILQAALDLGVIDIFTVIAWQTKGTTSDVIVQEIAEKVREARKSA